MTARLATALAEGLALPDGPVAVFGPPPEADLSALERGRVTIVSRFAPDVARWQARGFEVVQAAAPGFAAALVFVPRAKDAARARLAEAARAAPLLVVDGQKTDGVEPLFKALRGRVEVAGSVTKGHGRLFWFTGGEFPDWVSRDREVGGFVTRPGVFSADGPDKGSLALAGVLPHLHGAVADLGAGWGFLGPAILAAPAVTALHLVEADRDALDCARINVTDPRASFHWADATGWQPPAPLDAVVSNPPFHTGREGDPGLGEAFIAAAARALAPSGQFWMVANRHLPYEAALTRAFREVEEAGGTPGFKVIRAAKPHRQTRP